MEFSNENKPLLSYKCDSNITCDVGVIFKVSISTILSVNDMRQLSRRWHREEKLRVGFVPTMGALHDGHMSLVREAKTHCERVVVSIFVNPLQFGPQEDYARYPRVLSQDLDKLSHLGVDAVFVPNAIEMYPPKFQTTVVNRTMSSHLCGTFRPGHFEGVLTVVAKLIHIVDPDVAVFGKKDYQQWRLIETMVRDLAMPVTVIGFETLREDDGLAMSSRNRYLSAEQRAQASLVFQGMVSAKDAWGKGERNRDKIRAQFVDRIALCPDMSIQYAELVDSVDLAPVANPVEVDNPVLIVAVIYGDVRLIDNIEFSLGGA